MDADDRPEPPRSGDELATVLGFLDFLRATIAWKCDGLDAAELRATTAASSMTLGGLLKHLARVEDRWFGWTLLGRERSALWDGPRWAADPEWEWVLEDGDGPDELLSLWQQSVQRSRDALAEALTNGGLDQLARRPDSFGEKQSLRWILLHLVEEYGRHCGHADLLRESIDGSAGE